MAVAFEQSPAFIVVSLEGKHASSICIGMSLLDGSGA